VRPDELERWLCDPAAPAPSADDAACTLGLSFDAAPREDAAALLRRLRFTIAVLRDAFPNDGGVRRWLRTPAAALGGRRPLDLLLRERIDQLEELAVREWNATPRM
jgi:hypothetical protein